MTSSPMFLMNTRTAFVDNYNFVSSNRTPRLSKSKRKKRQKRRSRHSSDEFLRCMNFAFHSVFSSSLFVIIAFVYL